MILKNSKGSTSIMFVLLGTILMGTLIAVSYKNISMRSKQIRKIKETSNVQEVFELAAKTIRTARDTDVAADGMNWPPADPQCANTCTTLSGGVAPRMCFSNVLSAASPYCFYDSLLNVKNASNHRIFIPLGDDFILDEKPFVETKSLIAALNFFDSFIELPKANATGSINLRTDTAGQAPSACNPNAPAPGCLTCGGPNPYGGGPVTCVTLSACPTSYPGCEDITSTTTKKAFTQTIFLLPGGYTR